MAAVTARRWWPWLFVAAGLALAAAARVPTLAQPLLEKHSFRQTWTAWTAVIFHEQGIDLLHPQVPIFGPPFILISEFPLFQAIASLVMSLGTPADVALRATNLAFFLLSGLAIWGLVRRIAGTPAAYGALGFFLASPIGLVWSRTSMIEYLALGSAIAYLWAGVRWREEHRTRDLVAAIAAGVVSMLVKPTTLGAWPLALLLFSAPAAAPDLRTWVRERLDLRLAAIGLLPITAALVWLEYGAIVKQQQAVTSFLIPGGDYWNLYYYGTLGDRVNPAHWQTIGGRFLGLTVGSGVLPFFLLGIRAAFRSPYRAFWIGWLGAALILFAIFFGAFIGHDYYQIAFTAQVAAVSGLGFAWLWERWSTRSVRAAVAAAAVAAAALALTTSADYWQPIYSGIVDPDHVLERARELAAASRPDELVVSVGRSYGPDVIYYAHREALMLDPVYLSQPIVDAIPTSAYRVLVTWDPSRDDLYVARHWRWTGAVSPRVYRLADTPAELRGAPVIATDDRGVYDAAAQNGRELLRSPLVIPCDATGADVPVGRAGTLLRLRQDYSPYARVWLTYITGPMPVRTVMGLDVIGALGASSVRVTCAGTQALTVESVLDVTLPGR